MMTYAIQITKTGGPEVLEYVEIDTPKPQPHEVLIRQTYVGLNFIDVYFRTGLYNSPPPFIPGMEGVGTVIEAGTDVKNLKTGDRVGYASPPLGAYATERVMPANRVIKIPDSIDDKTAAGAMVKGMTAEYLLRRTYEVKAGETILFHAAAGGVGLIACQWAKHLGATVIGTVGSKKKAELAKSHGCDHVILYNDENISERVREITNGKGVPVVYDSVGQATFECSLNSLQKRGMLVSFGNASGSVPAFEPGILASKGSLFLTRPSMMDYTSDNAEYQESARTLFQAIEEGHFDIPIHQTYALKDAAQAHKDLEARKTTGSTILQC